MRIKSKFYAEALADLIMKKNFSATGEGKKIIDKFLKLLEKNGDFKKAKEILSLTETIFAKRTGRRKMTVEIARKMNVKQKNLVQSVSQQGDIIYEKIDKELIAGIKIIIGDNQLDCSIQNKLQNIFK